MRQYLVFFGLALVCSQDFNFEVGEKIETAAKVCSKDKCKGTRSNPIPRGEQWHRLGKAEGSCCSWLSLGGNGCSWCVPKEDLYERVLEPYSFCQPRNAAPHFTLNYLKDRQPNRIWYYDYGVGTPEIGNNGGASACAEICQGIPYCRYFSTTTTDIATTTANAAFLYGCFLYQTCDNPVSSPDGSLSDYRIYAMKTTYHKLRGYIEFNSDYKKECWPQYGEDGEGCQWTIGYIKQVTNIVNLSECKALCKGTEGCKYITFFDTTPIKYCNLMTKCDLERTRHQPSASYQLKLCGRHTIAAAHVRYDYKHNENEVYEMQGLSNTKCENTGNAEHTVRSLWSCEREAIRNNAKFFSFYQKEKKCFYSTTCLNQVYRTVWDWRVYAKDRALYKKTHAEEALAIEQHDKLKAANKALEQALKAMAN